MIPSVQIRLLGSVIGNPAIVIAAIGAVVYIAYFKLEFWSSFAAFVILAPLIIAGAFRLWRGGEQGAIDLVITQEGVHMSNIPLSVASDVLRQGLNVYRRQTKPLPMPAGVVQGNPAETTGVIELPSAGLPETPEIAEHPLKVPAEAVAAANIQPTVVKSSPNT